MKFTRQPMMLLVSIMHAANPRPATNITNSTQQETKDYEEMIKHIEEYQKDCELYNLEDDQFIKAQTICHDRQYELNYYRRELKKIKNGATSEQLEIKKNMREDLYELNPQIYDNKKKLEVFDTKFRAIFTLKENCSNTKLVKLIEKCRNRFSSSKLLSREIKSLQHNLRGLELMCNDDPNWYDHCKEDFKEKLRKMKEDLVIIEGESKAYDDKLYSLRNSEKNIMV